MQQLEAKPADPLQLLTSEEVCALLRVSYGTFSRWRRQGLLPRVALPGFARGYRFRQSDVAALISEAK